MDPNPLCDLHDEQLSQEIRLLGDFVLAASMLTRHLTQDEVDQILEQNHAPGDHFRAPDGAHRTAG